MGDLHQYVIEEEPFKPSKAPAGAGSSSNRPGPPVINLDDPAPVSVSVLGTNLTADARTKPSQSTSTKKPSAPQWSAPPNIAIYLSKIELPDLEQGRRKNGASPQGADAPGNAFGQAASSGGSGSGRPTPPSRPISSAPPSKLLRPQSNASQPSAGPSSRPPPPSTSPNGLPPPPGQHTAPPPPGVPEGQEQGSEGGQSKPNAGGGISLTRLFKAAASKV